MSVRAVRSGGVLPSFFFWVAADMRAAALVLRPVAPKSLMLHLWKLAQRDSPFPLVSKVLYRPLPSFWRFVRAGRSSSTRARVLLEGALAEDGGLFPRGAESEIKLVDSWSPLALTALLQFVTIFTCSRSASSPSSLGPFAFSFGPVAPR